MRVVLLCAIFVFFCITSRQAVTIVQVEKNLLKYLTSVNLMNILTNKRIMAMYMKCLLRRGPCSPEIRDFRRLLPRFLKHLCSYCNEQESESLRIIFQFVKSRRPEEWKQLEDVYDPKRINTDRIEKFIGKRSNNI
ncbi:ejaculatory bulb-specific protein 3-like [Cimex lectularius]|uniref:Chemosensory protein n=1 Tax=Cimex lectularius TaxID=79782 RepID=A0A8I6SB31_CIMLE|nr:ejaculatory bulb-specific protein 3-like [Cimex lectularius]